MFYKLTVQEKLIHFININKTDDDDDDEKGKKTRGTQRSG